MEIVQTREELTFLWKHPLINQMVLACVKLIKGTWNGYLKYFFREKIYSTYSSLFCFAETNIIDSPAKCMDEILDHWKDIHKNTQHGLALFHW